MSTALRSHGIPRPGIAFTWQPVVVHNFASDTSCVRAVERRIECFEPQAVAATGGIAQGIGHVSHVRSVGVRVEFQTPKCPQPPQHELQRFRAESTAARHAQRLAGIP